MSRVPYTGETRVDELRVNKKYVNRSRARVSIDQVLEEDYVHMEAPCGARLGKPSGVAYLEAGSA